MGRRWKVVAAVAALSLVGCSFLMRTNPKGWEPSQKPKCSDESPAEAGSVFGALLYAPAALYLLMGIAIDCENQSPPENYDALRNGRKYCLVGGTLAALGTVLFVDSVRATNRAVRCRNDRRLHRAWLAVAAAQRSTHGEAVEEEQKEKQRPPHETPGSIVDHDDDEAVEQEQREKEERCREIIDAWREEPAGSRALLWHTMPPHCKDLVPAKEWPNP